MVEAEPNERLWDQAERCLAERNPEAARSAYEALVALQPSHIMARLRLSTLATSAGRYRDSVAQLLKIADLRPAEPELLAMLAGMLHRLGETRAAMACLAHPSFDASTDKLLLEQAAQLASQMEAMATAQRLLDQADRIGGATAGSLYTRATLQLFAGVLAAAEATLESCLALAPGHAQAHWALSRVRRQSPERNHVARLQSLLARRPDPGSAVFLNFALFKELDELGRDDEAWDALMLGCAGKRAQLAYRPEEEDAAFAQLQRMTASGPVASRLAPTSASEPEPTPIFIVGMPRTGTTLLERMLGRHSAVENAGELDDLPLQLRWVADRFSKSYLDPAVFRAAGSRDPAQLGERYSDHVRWRARGKSCFTDKMPLNFLHVGFIARALPGARILHMSRNPMDTCFSNLKELFTEVYPYSYDLDDLAGHYGRYRRLMAHWHEQFPGRILDVSYERLVTEPEQCSREILAFCGLDWQDGCSDVEGSAGNVTTASSVQVREPIHRRSIDGWRRYERQLEPLRKRLQADGWLSP
jgi:tetratricopeptide (TPR) repeat protein